MFVNLLNAQHRAMNVPLKIMACEKLNIDRWLFRHYELNERVVENGTCRTSQNDNCGTEMEIQI